MKMSDVFELPVVPVYNEDRTQLHFYNKRAAFCAHAINHHDDLVQAIENLIAARESFKAGFLHAPELLDHEWHELECALAKAMGGQ